MDDSKDRVVIQIYRKTRQRIKSNAALTEKTMQDYVEDIVPGGEKE